MRLFGVIFFLIVFNYFSYSSIQDTSIFNSNYEKEIFRDLVDNDKFDLLSFLVAINYKSDSYEKAGKLKKEIISGLEATSFRKKSLPKQVKMIQKMVQTIALKNLEDYVVFNSLIDDGLYTNITATAIYAMVLDYFEIPFQIERKQIEIVIIVAPNDEKILLKPLPFKIAPIQFDQETKKEYVKFLFGLKIIPEDEYYSKSINNQFNKYYFGNKQISKRQLAAIHYFAKGMAYTLRENYTEANKEILKALLLDPENYPMIYTFNFVTAKLFEESKLNKNFDGYLLASYTNFNARSLETMNTISTTFEEIAQILVVKNSELEKFQKVYSEFKNAVSDTIDISSVDFVYSYYTGYYYFMKPDYKRCFYSLMPGYKINNDHLHLKNIVHDAFLHMFDDIDVDELSLDTFKFYYQTYDFLFDYKYFTELYILVHYNEAEKLLDQKKFDEVDVLLDSLNFKLLDMSAEINMDDLYDVYELILDECTAKSQQNYLVKLFRQAELFYKKDEYFKKNLQDFDKGIFPKPPVKYNYSGSYSNTSNNKKSSRYFTVEEYANKFKNDFKGSWCASYFRKAGDDNKVKMAKQAKIDLGSSKSVTYVYEGKTLKGKWSIRPESKLMYFTPDNDKNNYLTFRVIKFTKDKIELRPYDKNKNLTNYILIFERCK